MKKRTRIILTVILAAVFIVILTLLDQGVLGDNYVRRVLNLAAIYSIVAVSMNLVNGFTGLFSLGQAGFMAIGAFTVAIFTVPLEYREAIFYISPQNPILAQIELPFFAALLLGGFIAAGIALLIGAPVLRLKSDYLAIATLGFSEIIRIVFNNMQSITNGALGIKSIPGVKTMWLPFGVAAISIAIMKLLINSTYGLAFKAIKEDDIAAEAMGISLFKHKQLSFATGAFFAAIGGGLYASLLTSVEPKSFYFTFTYTFLLIIVLGGMGSVTGTVISSFLVTLGLEWLRFFDEPLTIGGVAIPLFRSGLRMVVFSILLMTIVLFFRNGLMSNKEFSWEGISGFFKRLFSRGKKEAGSNE